MHSYDNSKALYVIKAFAILSVIFAHCVYKNPTVQKMTSLIGIVGVPVFLICAGIFFNQNESPKLFWVKKVKGIVVPWMIFGTITYLLSAILGNDFSFHSFLFWLIGYGTWLYYVTILLLYYLLFRAIKWSGLPYVMIAVGIVSIVLDVYKLNPISNLIGNYLNMFSRVGFFAVGMLLKKENKIRIQFINGYWGCLSFISTIALVTAIMVFEVPPLVFFLLNLIYVLVAIVFLLFLSQRLANNRLLQNIGKQTYIIYFLHMQFGIGLVNKIINTAGLFVQNDWILFIIKPILVLSIVYAGITLLNFIITKLKLEKYKWIAGMR